MISSLPGSIELLNLATASPLLLMRNFSKFHSTSPAGLTLFKVVKGLKSALKKNNIPFIDNNSHIIPVIIGDPLLCKKASQILLDDFQVYVQPINYPTVPKGKERLRITASPQHSPKMIKKLSLIHI